MAERRARRSPASARSSAASKERRTEDPLADIECPDWWFPAGFASSGPIVVVLMACLFQIPVWAGVLALPLAVVMGVIAARVTGETDITPTKALGPVTQLIFGGLAPGQHLRQHHVRERHGRRGAARGGPAHDLKSGLAAGREAAPAVLSRSSSASSRAPWSWCPSSTCWCPTADVLGTEQFPAPASMVWAGVSKMLASGVSALHPTARVGALCGALLGITLVLLERWAPPKVKAFIPSASGLGLAIVIPGSSSISLFVGAGLAALLRRVKPKLAEDAVLPVSSGFIAGESLLGIAIAMVKAFGFMPK